MEESRISLLTTFRAGRMNVSGTTVSPDPRKGRINIIRDDESLVHFQWVVREQEESRRMFDVRNNNENNNSNNNNKNNNSSCSRRINDSNSDSQSKSTGNVNLGDTSLSLSSQSTSTTRTTDMMTRSPSILLEEDLIVFPEQFEWVRVEQCTTGRVYVLKDTSSPTRLFFWMQEPRPEVDETIMQRVNELLNDQSMFGEDLELDQEHEREHEQEWHAEGKSMEQDPIEQPQQHIGSSALTTPSNVIPQQQPSTGPGAVNLSDLQSFFQNFQQAGGAGAAARPKSLSLSEVLRPDSISVRLLPDVSDSIDSSKNKSSSSSGDGNTKKDPMSTLFQYLPECDRSKQGLLKVLRTPQFLQQLQALEHAITSGQVNGLLLSFSIDPGNSPIVNVEDFLNRFLNSTDRKS